MGQWIEHDEEFDGRDGTSARGMRGRFPMADIWEAIHSCCLDAEE